MQERPTTPPTPLAASNPVSAGSETGFHAFGAEIVAETTGETIVVQMRSWPHRGRGARAVLRVVDQRGDRLEWPAREGGPGVSRFVIEFPSKVLLLECRPGVAPGSNPPSPRFFAVLQDGSLQEVGPETACAATERAGWEAGGPLRNLPPLAGTTKQVAWAERIRAEFARRRPDDPRLRRSSRASWWIENRAELA